MLHLHRHLFALLATATLISGCQDLPEGNATNAHDHSQHMHGPLEVSSFGEQTPLPEVNFEITPDPMSGWNIRINTDNFAFAPDKVNQDAAAGEGHVHIFVDGFKFARVYSEWFHLKRLTPGPHTVTITLNANDHSTWTHNGQEISASRDIVQQQ